LVDICRFDGVDLLFELHDLALGLFKVLFVQFLSSEGCFGGCPLQLSISLLILPTLRGKGYRPFLFVVTFFLAMASCSDI
jgi:hypothetical protein